MNEVVSSRAVLLFDGDCGFCRRYIQKWKHITRNQVDYQPYQESLSEYPQISADQCKKAVQLIFADGRIYSGAHAVFKALSLSGKWKWILWLYESIPPVRWVCDLAYRTVARNRMFFSKYI